MVDEWEGREGVVEEVEEVEGDWLEYRIDGRVGDWDGEGDWGYWGGNKRDID